MRREREEEKHPEQSERRREKERDLSSLNRAREQIVNIVTIWRGADTGEENISLVKHIGFLSQYVSYFFLLRTQL